MNFTPRPHVLRSERERLFKAHFEGCRAKIQAYTFIVFFCQLAVEVFAADIKDRTKTSELIR